MSRQSYVSLPSAQVPVQRGCQRLEPRHILSLPGGCPGLGLALGLVGREHSTELVVNRRRAPRVGVLGVLGRHVGTRTTLLWRQAQPRVHIRQNVLTCRAYHDCMLAVQVGYRKVLAKPCR